MPSPPPLPGTEKTDLRVPLAVALAIVALALVLLTTPNGGRSKSVGSTKTSSTKSSVSDSEASSEASAIESEKQDEPVSTAATIPAESSTAETCPPDGVQHENDPQKANVGQGAPHAPPLATTRYSLAETPDAVAVFFGSRAQGKHFTFVVDRSASMRDDDRLQTAKEELLRALSQLPAQIQFSIIFYDARPLQLGSGRNTARDIPKMRKKIQAISPGGLTAVAPAIKMALSRQTDAVFLLSDGHVADAADAIVLNQQKVCIHTICLHDRSGEASLKFIAEHSNGDYRYIEKP